jgi:long-chain alkane monooxygenase
MFHLAWFLGNGYGIQAWSPANGDGPWVGGNVIDWSKPDLYIDLTRALERGGFDYLMIEDTAMVDDSYGGDTETVLRRGFMAPKNDPMPLVPLLARATRHIGVISTISTIQYHPYLAARLLTTLDHLTEGRVGMNVVTSVNDRVAQNFGYEQHFDHDERYRMALEWVELVRLLQGSWQEGAVVADPVNGRYADHTKVKPVDFVGKYFKSRGPLNTIPGPQGLVPVCSAGSSEGGRTLAAKYDDTMISLVGSVAEAKEYRIDMRRRVAEFGRDPDQVKFLFLISPTIEASDEEAREVVRLNQLAASSDAHVEERLWHTSYAAGGRIDFKNFPLDIPVKDIDLSRQNGEMTTIKRIFQDFGDKTLREAMTAQSLISDELNFAGSPDTVAAQMDEAMQEIGGDGFMLYLPTTRIVMAKVADGLSAALRRRGVIRDGFSRPTLRGHLQEF